MSTFFLQILLSSSSAHGLPACLTPASGMGVSAEAKPQLLQDYHFSNLLSAVLKRIVKRYVEVSGTGGRTQTEWLP